MKADINTLMYAWSVRNVFKGIIYNNCSPYVDDDLLITLKLHYDSN